MGILKTLKILMAQENMGDWMEYAREYAKAQREMRIKNGSVSPLNTGRRNGNGLFCSDMTFRVMCMSGTNGLSDGAMPGSCANILKRTFRHISHIMTGAPV